MSETPTPETDKAEDSDPMVEGEWQWIVPSSFARRLERERDEARTIAKMAYIRMTGLGVSNHTPIQFMRDAIKQWNQKEEA